MGVLVTRRTREIAVALTLALLISSTLGAEAQQAERVALPPLIDLHFHADQGLSPDKIIQTMDQMGVAMAGNGAKGPDGLWEPFRAAGPSRFLPFGGQGPIGRMIQETAEQTWALEAEPIVRYLDQLEQGLGTGRFRGIGELFVNNTRTHHRSLPPTKYPADSPLGKRLLSLSGKYAAPLSIHMDAETDSIAGLEALLAVDRKGIVIWAHCGSWADPPLVRRLLDQNSNLRCELSQRDAVHLARRARPDLFHTPITGFRTKLARDWKELLEAFSDRFLVGTDAADLTQYREIIEFYRKALSQLSPEAAQRIASGNAKRIFRLD